MDIIWHGLNCFSIKGEDATVVVDPYTEASGLELPKLAAHVVLVSQDDEMHNNVAGVSGDPKLFDFPGEYEAKGVLVSAVDAPAGGEEGNHTVLFQFSIDSIRVCHLGAIGEKLNESAIEAIGDVDILMIPIGGKTTIDQKVAHEIIEQIDPRVVIPMFYKTDGVKLDIDTEAAFMKEVGKHDGERVKKYSVSSRSSLPEENTEFILMERA
jgi:L-ascorbate metabolism protein UlaG (beta-lactamase superfamily)